MREILINQKYILTALNGRKIPINVLHFDDQGILFQFLKPDFTPTGTGINGLCSLEDWKKYLPVKVEKPSEEGFRGLT